MARAAIAFGSCTRHASVAHGTCAGDASDLVRGMLQPLRRTHAGIPRHNRWVRIEINDQIIPACNVDSKIPQESVWPSEH